MTDERDQADSQGHDQDGDEGFAEAWEQGDDLDVGADTSRFEAYRADDDTAELLRRQVRGDELSDEELGQATEPGGHGPASSGPSTAVILGLLVAVFLVIAALYVLT